MTEQDTKRTWQEDEEAAGIFAEAKQKAGDYQPLFAYAVSPSAAETIVDLAATLGASRLILGAPKRNAVLNLLARERSSRGVEFSSGRNRPARLCVNVGIGYRFQAE